MGETEGAGITVQRTQPALTASALRYGSWDAILFPNALPTPHVSSGAIAALVTVINLGDPFKSKE